MHQTFKEVGLFPPPARVKEMAAIGYMPVNPEVAHELRLFESPELGDAGRRHLEYQHKRELEEGITTWVKFMALEAMYAACGAWVAANRIATARLTARAKAQEPKTYHVAPSKSFDDQGRFVGVTVSVGGNGAASQGGTAVCSAGGSAVSEESLRGTQKHATDVKPRPPLDWKGEAKRFDPFKGFEVNARPAPQADTPDSGPLGKTFQPPTANGKSSWPRGKW